MKFFLDPPIEIVEGEETSVILDFQLHNTFSPIPGKDIESARSFRFHPNVRVAIRNNSGDIDGLVLQEDGTGGTLPAEGALVYLVETGETDTDQAIATTISEADGAAVFLGIAPGTYDLIFEFEDQVLREELLTVVAEGTTSFTVVFP